MGGFWADLQPRVNATVATHCGDDGVYYDMQGTQYQCSVLLHHNTAYVEADDGPIEGRPWAEIPDDQIPWPQRNERVNVNGVYYIVDRPAERDDGMWRLSLIRES